MPSVTISSAFDKIRLGLDSRHDNGDPHGHIVGEDLKPAGGNLPAFIRALYPPGHQTTRRDLQVVNQLDDGISGGASRANGPLHW